MSSDLRPCNDFIQLDRKEDQAVKNWCFCELGGDT